MRKICLLEYGDNEEWIKAGVGKLRPAEGLENAKKNEVSKNICANLIKPSKMKAE
jgi:hypothetical protein